MTQEQHLHQSRTPGLDRGHSRRRAESTSHSRQPRTLATSPLPPSYNTVESQFRHLSIRSPSPRIPNVPAMRGNNIPTYGRVEDYEVPMQSTRLRGMQDQNTTRGHVRSIEAYDEYEQRATRHHRRPVDENLRRRSTSTGPLQGREESPSQVPKPRGHRPEFIIVGLFALRLARRLMDKLNSYPEKDADAAWIDWFLSQYTADNDLAELRGRSIDDFAKTWPAIISHFINQPKYPLVFTHINPISETHGLQRSSDKEIKDMVDFADAAAEWGSVVSLPRHEAQRIESLASQRKVAYWDH